MRHKSDQKIDQKCVRVPVYFILTVILSLMLAACASKAWYQSYGFDTREDALTIASVPVLIDALGDQDARVREQTAETLAEIGPDARDAVPALIEVLQEDVLDVRMAAADALEAIELETVINPDDEDVINAQMWVSMTRLESSDWMVKRDAAKKLAELGPAAVTALPALIKAIEDRSDWREHYHNRVLAAAVTALGNIGPQARTATPGLINLMDSKDFTIRLEVVKALGKIGPPTDPAVKEALIEAIHGDPELIGLRDSLASLIPAKYEDQAYRGMSFGDPDCDVRREAAAILGRFEADAVSAVPILLEVFLTDINPNVRRQAAISLCEIQPGGGAAMIALDKAIDDEDGPLTRETAVLELRNTPPEYRESWLPRIVSCLDDIEDGVRLNAVKTLAEFKIGNDMVYKALLRLALEDKSLIVKAEAKRTLNYLKSIESVE